MGVLQSVQRSLNAFYVICVKRKNTKISKMKTNKILIYMEYLTVSVNCLVFLGLPYRKPMPQSMTTNT